MCALGDEVGADHVVNQTDAVTMFLAGCRQPARNLERKFDSSIEQREELEAVSVRQGAQKVHVEIVQEVGRHRQVVGRGESRDSHPRSDSPEPAGVSLHIADRSELKVALEVGNLEECLARRNRYTRLTLKTRVSADIVRD